MGNLTQLSNNNGSNQQNETLYTYVVDPNPSENQTFPAEDYLVYVNFEAFQKNRSVVLTDGTFTNTRNKKSSLSFISTKEINGDEYTTTDWTNIGGNQGSTEGFGIESIEINIKEKFVPTVDITFVDVRGGALFNNHEFTNSLGELDNDSPYAAFFKLPYPMFKLTIKAEYGEASSYCLHLMNFNVEFDASRGSFVIQAKFIGFEFAFFSDIQMRYVMALNSTANGAEYLNQYDVTSLEKYMNAIGQLTQIGANFKANNQKYQELTLINTLLKELNEIQGYISKPVNSVRTSIYGNFLSEPKLENNVDQVFIRDVGVISELKRLQHTILTTQISSFAQRYNQLINDNLSQYTYLNTYTLNNYQVNTPNSSKNITVSFVNEINGIIKQFEPNYNTVITKDALESRLNLSNNSNKDFFIVSYYELRARIQEIITQLQDKKDSLEDEVNKELNQTIETSIGIDLTIGNMFYVILQNVESFMDMLYDVSVKADSDSLQPLRISAIQGNVTDINDPNNRIYPFPSVFDADTGEQVWLGDVVGNNNAAFPELRLVDDVLNALVSISNKQIETKIQQFSQANLQIVEGVWFPINVNDKIVTPFNATYNVDGTSVLPSNFASEILRRYYTLTEQSKYLTKNLNHFASFDGVYGATTINNPKFIRYISNLTADDFANALISNKVLPNDYTISLYKINDYVENIATLNTDVQRYVADRNIDLSSFMFTSKEAIYSRLSKDFIINNDLSTYGFDNDVRNKILAYFTSRNNINVYDKSPDFFPIKFVNNLGVFDGYNGQFVFNESIDNKLAKLRNEKIGKDIFGGSLFSSGYYTNQTDNLLRGFLLFDTLGVAMGKTLFDSRLKQSCNLLLSEIQLLYWGSRMYRLRELRDNNVDIIDVIGQNSGLNGASVAAVVNAYKQATDTGFGLQIYKQSNFIDTLASYYESWMASNFVSFESDVELYVDLMNRQINTSPNAADYQDLKDVTTRILVFYNKLKSITIENPNIFTDISVPATYEGLSDANLTSYAKSWFNAFKTYSERTVEVVNRVDSLRQQEQAQFNYITDKDFKLATYSYFKNLYDKWVAGNIDGKLFNNCAYIRDEEGSANLFNMFHFVDRTWSAIGDVAVANPRPLRTLSQLTDLTLYNLLHTIADENNFSYFALPNYTNFSNVEAIKSMFEPKTTLNDDSSGASYVMMYVGGTSKSLNISDDQFYVNDGFDLRTDKYDTLPNGFKQRRKPLNYAEMSDDEKNKYNLVAFRVAFGDQNQSIFKNVNVSQKDFRETSESIALKEELFGQKGKGSPLYKGQNLYNIYSVRSYSSSVTSLGNMQIQPLQYYQLDNLNMFSGAYLITSVNHMVVPHKVTTTFKGVRMPRYVYPIIDQSTTVLNISLNDTLYNKKFEEERQYLDLEQIEGLFGGDADDFISGIDLATFSPNGLVAANDAIIQYQYTVDATRSKFAQNPVGQTLYVLDKNITSVAQLEQSFDSVFPPNTLPSTFTANGAEQCYKWVANALAAAGVQKLEYKRNANGLPWPYVDESDSWVTPVSIPTQLLGFVPYSEFANIIDKPFNGAVCQRLGIPDGSIIFGYYLSSNYIDRAYDRMLTSFQLLPKPDKQQILAGYLQLDKKMQGRVFNRASVQAKGKTVANVQELGKPYKFAPTTHTLFYYKGVLYHNINGQIRTSTGTLRPICWYSVKSRCIDLINDRNNGVGNNQFIPSITFPTIPIGNTNTLVINNDGTFSWDGNADLNANVKYKNIFLLTKLQDGTTRTSTAKEFMDRCHWILGEGGGNLSTYYASAIQNRLSRIGTFGVPIGQEGTPSNDAKSKISSGTGLYGQPLSAINDIFNNNVNSWNFGKSENGQPYAIVSKANAEAMLNNLVVDSNAWSVDNNGDGYVWNDIRTNVNLSGLAPNSKIYIRRNPPFITAFYNIQFGGDAPTRQNIVSRYINIP